MLSDRAAREFFHFVFLGALIRASRPELYVLEGGVNLRFFHGSPRYSEDMDLDVRSDKVSVQTLRKNGCKVLEDRALRRLLATQGIVDLQVNDPKRAKQAGTTQRFRLSLVLGSGQALPTKVEFSRRGIRGQPVLERVDPEIARRYGRTSFHCSHYGPVDAARQKIGALAGRTTPQARDLFDLYLLDSRGALDVEVLRGVDPTTLETASEVIAHLTFEDYEGQVLEYLDDEDRREFGSRETFGAMQDRVFGLLTGGPA